MKSTAKQPEKAPVSPTITNKFDISYFSARIVERDLELSHRHFVKGLVFKCPFTGIWCWLRNGSAVLQNRNEPERRVFCHKPVRRSWLPGLSKRLPAWVRIPRMKTAKKNSGRAPKSETSLALKSARRLLSKKCPKIRPWLKASWQTIYDDRLVLFLAYMSQNGWSFDLDDSHLPVATSGGDQWCFEYMYGAAKEIRINNVSLPQSGDAGVIRADVCVGYNETGQLGFVKKTNGAFVFEPTLKTLDKLQNDLGFCGFAEALRFCGVAIIEQLAHQVKLLEAAENEEKLPTVAMAPDYGDCADYWGVGCSEMDLQAVPRQARDASAEGR